MKKLLTTILLALLSINVFAQVTFQETIGASGQSSASSVIQTNDGGFIATGFTNSSGAGNQDVYLVKTSSTGNVIWTKTYGGPLNDFGNTVQKTTDGGFVIAGTTNSFGAGGYDVYVIKTDSIGDTLWTKTYGGTLDDGINNLTNGFGYPSDKSNYIQQTSDGGYIIASSTKSYGQGGHFNIYLLKTNNIGDTLWTKTYGDTINYSSSGTSVKQTSDGGYIVIGNTISADTAFGTERQSSCLIKTDMNGNIQWTKVYYNQDPDYAEVFGSSVFQTSNSGYYVSGLYHNVFNGDDSRQIYYLKTDSTGNILSSNNFFLNDGYMNGFNDGASACLTNDGGLAITAYTSDYLTSFTEYTKLLLFKVSSTGSVWMKNYGHYNDSIYGNSVIQTTDGGFAIVGTHGAPAIRTSIYFIKTDSLGSSTCNDSTYNRGAIWSNPIAGITPLFITGSGSIVHSPFTQVTNAGGTAKDYCSSVGIEENNINNTITIAPNPTTSLTTITFTQEQTNTTIKVYNVLGHCVLQSPPLRAGREGLLDMTPFASGIYFLRIEDEKKNIVNRKIIKN